MDFKPLKKRQAFSSSHTAGTGVYIQGIGWNRFTAFCSNADIGPKTGHLPSDMESLTGIRTRARWDGDPVSLAMGAIADLAEKAGTNHLAGIDLIIVSSSTPILPLPQTAALIAGSLGENARGVPAFDLSASCSGYLYGLSVAQSMIHSGGYQRVLFVTLEKKSPQLCPTHGPETAILFGDMATATLLTGEPGLFRIEGTLLGAKGELASIIRRETDPCNGAPVLRMEGARVYREAIKTLEGEIPGFLNGLGTSLQSMDLIVFHQANGRLLDTLSRRLALNRNKIPLSLDTYGNTSSSSIPLTLARHLEETGVIPQSVLLAAFGGGATFGMTLLTGNSAD